MSVTDWMSTWGVVTVEQEEVLALLLKLDKNWTFDSQEFLKRFGMRPKVEEHSQIWQHEWEFFLALQTFMRQWSRQYSSSVQLTFMPEVYPGMRIKLEDHDLEVYVESVTHTGNYASGFATTVQVTAPVRSSGGLISPEIGVSRIKRVNDATSRPTPIEGIGAGVQR